MALDDVVPFFTWGLLGVAILLLFVFLAHFFSVAKQFIFRTADNVRGEGLKERQVEREQEGVWWWVAEILAFLIIIVMLIVGVSVVNYLVNSPPDVSIYSLVLQWAFPLVLLTIMYFAFKTVGQIQYRALEKTEGDGGEESDLA
jgi:mannose/fructose/N-acetylgalactosamine-specific phosphotransferase system component IIC